MHGNWYACNIYVIFLECQSKRDFQVWITVIFNHELDPHMPWADPLCKPTKASSKYRLIWFMFHFLLRFFYWSEKPLYSHKNTQLRIQLLTYFFRDPMIFAGIPPIIEYEGNDFVTTDPAPTTVPFSMVTPALTTTFAPRYTSSWMVIGA